jgi:hypothetical protein
MAGESKFCSSGLVSRDLGYIPAGIAGGYLEEAGELLRMLHGLRRRVQDDGGVKRASRSD